MADRHIYDVIFLGGGLAAGLAAILLRNQRPDLSVLILEGRTQPLMPQTWSFQSLPRAYDPSPSAAFSSPESSWLKDLISKSWEGYDVRFPGFTKRLNNPYHSIRSVDFWHLLRGQLGPSLREGDKVVSVDGRIVSTASGRVFEAKHFIDSRGWSKNAFPVAGYQKFIGLNITTSRPHGLKAPILMDATVAQLDGFRFLYTLPWSETELLIEDTRYSNSPDLDGDSYTSEILAYADQQRWTVASLGELEQGALALPSFSEEGLKAHSYARHIPQIGARGGLFHPTTGYSIYDAVVTAERLLESCEDSLDNLGPALISLGKKRWADQEFYRRLNNMLFFAARPDLRYRVLQRFYEHGDDLISRFYAGQTTTQDKIRIMSGKPPIPMKRAVYHFFNRIEVQHGPS